MRRQSRRQRVAISQAKIRKKCKSFGALMQGFRAYFDKSKCIETNPYSPTKQMNNYQAWLNGWYMARLRAEEKR